MSWNLVLGLFAILVGTTTLVVRFALPVPPRTVEDPYAHLARRGCFMPLTLGLVPILAGIAFLGAWWQEREEVRDIADFHFSAPVDVPSSADDAADD